MGIVRAIGKAAILLAGTALASAASAMPITFNFPDLIQSGSYTSTPDARPGGPGLNGQNEQSVETATFSQGGFSMTFTAADGRTSDDPASADGEAFVFLDERPRHPGAGIGICQNLSGAGCLAAGGDEIALATGDILFADFGAQVTISDLLFSEENNLAPFGGSRAEDLVAISVDGADFMDFDSSVAYTGSIFGFAVQLEPEGSFHAGYEFYLHELTVVPLPASVWLFGTALLCLAGFNSRKRRRPLL